MKGILCGVASNHADVMHWFKRHNKTMDDFRKDVAKMVNTVNDKDEHNIVLKEPFEIGNQQLSKEEIVEEKDVSSKKASPFTNFLSKLGDGLNIFSKVFQVIKRIFKK